MILAVAMVFWAAREKPQPSQLPPQPEQAQKPPEQGAQRGKEGEAALEARGVEIERRDETGKLKWKLVARGKMKIHRQQGTVVAEDVRWTLETPDKVWQARAKGAKVEETENDVMLTGGVELSTVDGDMEIKAERAKYEMKSGRLVMEGPVEMQACGAEIKAERAVVDLKRKVLRAVKVRGHYAF